MTKELLTVTQPTDFGENHFKMYHRVYDTAEKLQGNAFDWTNISFKDMCHIINTEKTDNTYRQICKGWASFFWYG